MLTNGMKLAGLLGLLTGLFLVVGYALGGRGGMTMALLVSVGMNFVSVWWSDKIVLGMHKAKEITNKADPVYEEVEMLAKKAQLPMPKVYRFEDASPNAFATGRDKNHAAVAVSTGLEKILEREEMRGVLGHELAHIKNSDILVSSVAATMAGAISTLIEMTFGMFAMMSGRNDDEEGVNPIVGIGLAIGAPIMAMLIQMAISRSREFVADADGAKIAGSKMGLATALLKLENVGRGRRTMHDQATNKAASHLYIVNHLSVEQVGGWFATHPPTKERVRRLKGY